MPSVFTIASLAALVILPIMTGPSQAVPPQPGQDPIEWCLLDGGEIIDQPPGSGINACCTEDGCIICDENWGDCTFDPAYGSRPNAGRTTFGGPGDGPGTVAPTEPSPAGDRFSAPALIAPLPGQSD